MKLPTKLLVFLLALAGSVVPSALAQSPLAYFCAASGILGSTTTYYFAPFPGFVIDPGMLADPGTCSVSFLSNVETTAGQWMALKGGGTAKHLACLVDTAPGSGKTWTFTLRQNAAGTALTCAITGTSARSCVDTTHTVSVSAGDLLAVQAAPTSSPAAESTVECQYEITY